MKNLSIRIRKFIPSNDSKKPVSQTIVDVSEIGSIDANEQAQLRARY